MYIYPKLFVLCELEFLFSACMIDRCPFLIEHLKEDHINYVWLICWLNDGLIEYTVFVFPIFLMQNLILLNGLNEIIKKSVI